MKDLKIDPQLSCVLSRALRAICLTRDYVGEEMLPPIKGWEWYDTGVVICKTNT